MADINILAETLERNCVYNCGTKFSLPDLLRHSEICPLRPIRCRFGCSSMIGTVHGVLSHIKKYHDPYDLEETTSGKYSYNSSYILTADDIKLGKFAHSNLSVAEYDGQSFVIEEHVYTTKVQFIVSIIGTSEMANKYRAKVSICGTDMVNKWSTVLKVKTPRDILEEIEQQGQLAEIPAITILKWSEYTEPQPNTSEWNVTLKLRKCNSNL